jgi:hypothetical protein
MAEDLLAAYRLTDSREPVDDHRHALTTGQGVDHFLNSTRKVCVLPSLRPRSNCTHVPALLEAVFQALVYWSAVESYCSELPPP